MGNCVSSHGSGQNGASIYANEGYNNSDWSVKLDGALDENIFSGPYDFTGFTRVTVSFYAKTNNWGGNDKYHLEIKIGNGSYLELDNWGENPNWTARSVDVTQSGYLTETITIRIINNANNTREDVYIDNASIIGYCD